MINNTNTSAMNEIWSRWKVDNYLYSFRLNVSRCWIYYSTLLTILPSSRPVNRRSKLIIYNEKKKKTSNCRQRKVAKETEKISRDHERRRRAYHGSLVFSRQPRGSCPVAHAKRIQACRVARLRAALHARLWWIEHAKPNASTYQLSVSPAAAWTRACARV